MNDFTDDLLDDLDSMTSELEEVKSPSKSNSKKTEGSLTSSANEIDAASVSLEAAKASQEAAIESQKAADATIHISQDLKSQIIELSDSNTAWRQATRHANIELKSVRSSISITIYIIVFVSFVSAGLAGWLFYQVFQENKKMKDHILDMIQTENMIFNQGINAKVDQLSSLIEALSDDIYKLEMSQEGHVQEEKIYTSQHTTEEHIVNLEPNVVIPDETATKIQLDTTTTKEFKSVTTEQYKELKHLVNQILDKQQKLQSSLLILSNKVSKSVKEKPSVIDLQGGLTTKQAKQLGGINWLIRQQENTLKEIKASLHATKKTQSDNDLEEIRKILNALKLQIHGLSLQQNTIESQVKVLQKETERLSAAPKPYSFRLRE